MAFRGPRLLMVLALPAAIAAAPAGNARRGVYSEAQAAAGAALYSARCALCHGSALEGAFEIPPLQGRFIANWSKAPLGDLFGYIAGAMPQQAPGSLSPDENAKILAFLLKANGYPAGPQGLPADKAALMSIALGPTTREAPAAPRK